MGWLLRLRLVEGIDDDATERVASLLWDLGTTGVAHVDDHLLAGFDAEAAAAVAAATVSGAVGVAAAATEPVDDGGWVDPDLVGDLDVGGVTVALAVGPAFGHGRHPTTLLALDLMGRVGVGGADVLDLGTGTGVLAIAAAAGGARSVRAVDNDPAALAVARHNVATVAGRDGADGRPWAPIVVTDTIDGHLVGDDTIEGDTAGDAGFDVVVANVLVGTHATVGPDLARRLRPDGHLVVAGVLVAQRPDVERAYPGLQVTATATADDWLGLVLRHRPTHSP